MHYGCTGEYESGKEIVDKIRMMGFNATPLAVPLSICCSHCRSEFQMEMMETPCPACGMVYGVTPCHSHSPEFAKPAGINY